MAANPRADWTIEDVKSLAKKEGLEVRLPNGGSHTVVSSPLLRESLCIPAKRPIKPRYIKELVGYARAHNAAWIEDGERK